jgi:hypothetical protein
MPRRFHRPFLMFALLACAAGLAACAATRDVDRARLAEDAMRLDSAGGSDYLRLKMEAAREGALGGYGDAVAGGCGCQ